MRRETKPIPPQPLTRKKLEAIDAGAVLHVLVGVGLYGIPQRGVMRVCAHRPGAIELEFVEVHPSPEIGSARRWYTYRGKDRLTNGRGWFRVTAHAEST